MSETKQIGPFLCEWCSTPMTSLQCMPRFDGSRIDGQAVGFCPKCNTKTWSKPVPKPNESR